MAEGQIKRGGVAVVGIGETEQGRMPDRDRWDLLVDASVRAIEDSGLGKEEIDGVITCGSLVEPHSREHLKLSDELGMPLRTFTDTTMMGGSSGAAMIRYAAAAIEAGMATSILVAAADNLLTASSKEGGTDSRSAALQSIMSIHDLEFIEPYGNMPSTNFAMITRRYMHEFGWTREQFAHVAVAHREHAIRTPGAVMKKEISIEDVLSAPPICEPLGRLDCSIVSDGGVAYVISRADRVDASPHKPVYLLGGKGIYASYYTPGYPDLVDFPRSMIERTTQGAFDMAGVERADIDLVSVPDVFTPVPAMMLDACGFVEKGEGAAFVASGAIGPGGSLPVNTHGGNLAYTHPGNPGQMFNVVELVKQLRGDQGERQVPDAELAFIHSFGGTMSQHTSLVLGNRL
jgi:acetyl-CoA acetyltransferase